MQEFKFDFSGFNAGTSAPKNEPSEETTTEQPKAFDFNALKESFAKKEAKEPEAKKKEESPKEEKEEVTKETNNKKESEVEDDSNPFETESVEVKSKEEEPKEEVSKEETTKEKASEPEAKEKTEPVEEPKEEKPKKKRHRRTKKELESEKKEAESVEKTAASMKPEDSNPPKIMYAEPYENHIKDYNECVNTMFAKQVDNDWESKKEVILDNLDKIKMGTNITPATLSGMAVSIDETFDMIAQYYYQYKAMLEQLTDKETGKLSYIKGINGVGSNPEERKRNAWIACAAYKQDDVNCNLLEIVNITRERFEFLSCCFERIKNKQNILYTLTANLKMAGE
jgi:chemotaxis protein histidine kinase CheA